MILSDIVLPSGALVGNILGIPVCARSNRVFQAQLYDLHLIVHFAGCRTWLSDL